MKKEKLVELNKWLIALLIILQPFVNLFKRNIANDIQVFGFSLFEMLNIGLVILSLIITICLYNSKKNFKKFIVLIPVFIIYCIVHYINIKQFNLSIYEKANPNFLEESYYLFRIFMVPLLLIISMYYSGIKKDSCVRIIEICSLVLSLFIVIPNLLGIAYSSYGAVTSLYGNIFTWFTFKSVGFYDYYSLASIGLFGGTNQISAVLFMISPVIIYSAYRKHNIYNYILLFMHSLAMLMVGTRVANLGIMLVYLAFIGCYIVLKIRKNAHHSIKPILIIFMIITALFCFSPVSHNIRVRISGENALPSILKTNNVTDERKKVAISLFEEAQDYECNNLSNEEENHLKTLLSKEYIEFLGISKYITRNYSVDKHTEFWCDYVKDYSGINYRELKTDIYKNIYTENNNKYDKWLGLGYTSHMIYTETDYTFQFFSYGIIGIIILLGPYFACILYLMYKILRYNKKYFKFENIMYLMGVILAVIAAYFSGHVLETTLTLVTLASLIGLNMINLSDEKEYKKKAMFIASTGGHLSEMMQLKKLYDKYDYRIVTEKTKSTKSMKKEYGCRIKYLVFGTKDHIITYPFKFLYNCIKSFIIFIIFNPKVIITTGTHTAVPMCYIGKFFGAKIIYIETFANSNTRTLAGRLVYPIADTFIVQWKDMLKLYPKAIYGGWIY